MKRLDAERAIKRDLMRMEIDAPLRADEQAKVRRIVKSKEVMERFVKLVDAFERADTSVQIEVMEKLGMIEPVRRYVPSPDDPTQAIDALPDPAPSDTPRGER